MSKKFTSSWLLRNAQTILCPSDPTRDNRILLVGWRLWLSELAPGSPLMYERGPQSNTIPITHSLLFEIFYWNFGYLTGGNRSAIIHQPKIMIKVERLPVFYIHIRLKSMSIKLLCQWWQAAAASDNLITFPYSAGRLMRRKAHSIAMSEHIIQKKKATSPELTRWWRMMCWWWTSPPQPYRIGCRPNKREMGRVMEVARNMAQTPAATSFHYRCIFDCWYLSDEWHTMTIDLYAQLTQAAAASFLFFCFLHAAKELFTNSTTLNRVWQ